MSKNVQISLSHDELVEVCSKLKCVDSELGRVIKASILEKKHSEYFREFDNVEHDEKIPIHEQVKEMTNVELKKYIGVKRNADTKAIRAYGLHFKNNVEFYLTQFLAEWMADPHRVTELMNQMREYRNKEFVTRELSSRMDMFQ